MATIIKAIDPLEAWVEACWFLLREKYYFNLILDVKQASWPNDDLPLGAFDILDEMLSAEGIKYTTMGHAVRIFPNYLYEREGLDGVLKTYPDEVFPDLLLAGTRAERFEGLDSHQTKASWGTYAYRMIRNECGHCGTVRENPLSQLIYKMRSELSVNRGPMRACYELPTYRADLDAGRRYGLPCLSHLSFKVDGPLVHVTAFYRSQDYRTLALSNFIGISQLLSCVARETGQTPGTLTVHSSYAYLPGAKGSLETTLNRISRWESNND